MPPREPVVVLGERSGAVLKELVETLLPIVRADLIQRGLLRATGPVVNQHEGRDLRVTSTTLTSGRYPGKLVRYDSTASTYTDLADIWVVPLSGSGSLTVGYYHGQRWGTANSRPVFTADPGAGSAGGAGGGVFSGARVYDTGTTTINQIGGHTRLLFGFERWDTDGYHSTSSNQGRFTIPADGYYLIGGQCEFSSDDSSAFIGRLGLLIGLNYDGATPLPVANTIGTVVHEYATAEVPDFSVHTVYRLVAGDYVQLWTFAVNNGTGNWRVNGGSSTIAYRQDFWIARLGV